MTKLNNETSTNYGSFIFPTTGLIEPDNGSRNHKNESVDDKDLQEGKTFPKWNSKCASCNVEFGSNHTTLSPNCTFVNSKQNDLSTLLQPLAPGQDVCGNVDTFPDSVKILRKIIYPYENFGARIDSFKNWPKSAKQDPEKLVEAGFYYKGFDDKTVCFTCSGPLSNWEDEDDPWEQHARWFPKCKFLLNSRGQGFVDEVRKRLNVCDSYGREFGTAEEMGICQDGLNKDRSADAADEDRTCIICCTNQREVIFIPCGHDWTCSRCVNALEDKKCPVCREQIVKVHSFRK